MLLNRLACDLVVHQGGHEVLKRLAQLINYGLIGSLFLLLLQHEVHFDDLLVGISQVILTAHGA